MADPQEQRLQFISVGVRKEERLKFVSLSFTNLGGKRSRARVALETKPGRTAVGTSAGSDSKIGRLWSAAHAMVEAIKRAVDATPDAFELLDLKHVKVFDATAVIVAIAVRYDTTIERMVGFCVVDTMDPDRAGPLAVLNGTNRFLGAVFDGKISWKKPILFDR